MAQAAVNKNWITGSFDKNAKKWICCPLCGSKDVNKQSAKTGKAYVACFEKGCKVFLNVDKSGAPIVREMD